MKYLSIGYFFGLVMMFMLYLLFTGSELGQAIAVGVIVQCAAVVWMIMVWMAFECGLEEDQG